MELNLKEKQKLTKITAKKYQRAKWTVHYALKNKAFSWVQKKDKTKILDTFIGQTGYVRKYAIHILANEGRVKYERNKVRLKAAHGNKKKRVYPRVYDQAVLDALIPLWEAFNRQCGKLFAPFLRANLDSIVSEPGFHFCGEVIKKLGKISASAVDRLLKPYKAGLKIKGTGGTKPAAKHLKAMIPALSHFQCAEQGSGLWQIDLVQHDGGNPSDEFCYTLTVTEVKNAQALNDACSQLPLPVRVLHSDNGSEFVNNALAAWCRQRGIALTRSRGNRKNDNCYVEQKNGASVRKIVGYARFCGDTGVAVLRAVYTHYDRLLNYYYLCQKLVNKERADGKVRKTYDKPMSPYDRVITDPDAPEALKLRLRSLKKKINLMAEMKRMQQAVDKLPSLAEPVPAFVVKQGMKPLLFGSLG